MKILHIHPTLSSGGVEAMICGLANEMSELGHDVTVCCIFSPKPDDVFWNSLSDKVKKDNLGKTKPGFSIKEVLKIFEYVRRGNFDVINVHGFLYYYALSVIFYHKNVKIFYTIHSDAAMENSLWDKRIMSFKRMCFRRHWIFPITISEASNTSFCKLYGCDGKLIHNGVTRPRVKDVETVVDDCKLSENTKVFLHPGRITLAKNQEVLCKVFSRIIEEGYDVVLIIAGYKENDVIYSKLLPFFSNRIKYIGVRNDIPQLLARADAFCLCSIWEGLPVTLLEALSVGCIPICSPVGGIINVVNDGVNGILSDSSSSNAYYDAIIRFLSMSDDEISSMKENCQASFEPYDISITAKNYIKYYNETQL